MSLRAGACALRPPACRPRAQLCQVFAGRPDSTRGVPSDRVRLPSRRMHRHGRAPGARARRRARWEAHMMTIFRTTGLFGLLLIALGGCATVPLAPPTSDAEAKTFATTADRSVIYVYR